jgi:hypothetical protein
MSVASQLREQHERIKAAFRIRHATADDRNAIMSSWLRSYWDDKGPQLVGVTRQLFDQEHARIVDAALARPDVITLVACDAEHDRHIMSWMCGELTDDELVLHYAFTFQAFRAPDFRLVYELFKAFLAERGERKIVVSHRTRAVHRWIEANGFTFNPYRIPR